MAQYRYRVVDVFTEKPLEGNPLAVFPEAAGIDDATMQKIAKELNLSETTFVLPPTRSDCAAQVRIFTPARELIFAGHPTIGTAYVLLDERKIPGECARFALEEKVGPVPVRVNPGERPMIWLTTPPIQFGKTYDRGACAKALGVEANDLLDLDPQWASAGNPNIYIALKDRAAVDRAWCDQNAIFQIKSSSDEPLCIFVFTPTLDGAYSRMFAPEYGVVEDPATGSATGPLAAFMMRHKLAPSADGTRFVSEQGAKMGRRSFLYLHVHGEHGSDGIEVGGYVTPLVDAIMNL